MAEAVAVAVVVAEAVVAVEAAVVVAEAAAPVSRSTSPSACAHADPEAEVRRHAVEADQAAVEVRGGVVVDRNVGADAPFSFQQYLSPTSPVPASSYSLPATAFSKTMDAALVDVLLVSGAEHQLQPFA